jgi:Ca-activated chloride channel family protein
MRRTVLFLFVLLALTLLAGCGDSAETVTVLAGSELRDMEPLFDQIERNTGVRLEMEYIGTLDGADQLLSGADVDLAWFSHAKYLTLLQGQRSVIKAQEKIMLSPVVLGVNESKARQWGWIDNPDLTWQEIADKAGAGELRFAMTNPASSNSGFTALVGVASALSGSSGALITEDVDVSALQTFFRGQALTAGSSGWLAERYVADQERLDGMINYESVLLGLNKGRDLSEKLYLVYPKEGIITADYPLMLINEEKRDAYNKLVEYLRSPEFQREIVNDTLRRPVIPGVALSNDFPDALLVELPFPNSAEVLDQLLFSFLDEQRVPSHAIFVLDVSGSMDGDRLNDLKSALTLLTGYDESLTGRFARFRARERITLIPFSAQVEAIENFTIDTVERDSASMEEIRDYVESLRADGGTAIYTSLQQAYEVAAVARNADPERYYSIVLMSDGESNEGISEREFERYYNQLPAELQQVRTFTILFGNADREAMEDLAALTGGRMFNAQNESLNLIFKEIRGYQ